MEQNEASKQAITDAPIRVATLAALPTAGVEGQLYRCDDTRTHYIFQNGLYKMVTRNTLVRWQPFERLIEPLKVLIQKARTCEWMYIYNPNVHVKYIEIRIDMRSGDCIIKDNRGNVITLEQLQLQESRVGRSIAVVESAKQEKP